MQPESGFLNTCADLDYNVELGAASAQPGSPVHCPHLRQQLFPTDSLVLLEIVLSGSVGAWAHMDKSKKGGCAEAL